VRSDRSLVRSGCSLVRSDRSLVRSDRSLVRSGCSLVRSDCSFVVMSDCSLDDTRDVDHVKRGHEAKVIFGNYKLLAFSNQQ
jgi:hypothetical protein